MRTFDLFRQFGPKKALWLSDFSNLADAEIEMKKMAVKEPGAYFIYDEDAASAVARIDSGSLTTASKPFLQQNS